MVNRLGLTFETWMFHPQIGDLADLAGAFPNARILLAHVGGPLGIGPYRGKRDEVFSHWAALIKALAAHPLLSRHAGILRADHKR